MVWQTTRTARLSHTFNELQPDTIPSNTQRLMIMQFHGAEQGSIDVVLCLPLLPPCERASNRCETQRDTVRDEVRSHLHSNKLPVDGICAANLIGSSRQMKVLSENNIDCTFVRALSPYFLIKQQIATPSFQLVQLNRLIELVVSPLLWVDAASRVTNLARPHVSNADQLLDCLVNPLITAAAERSLRTLRFGA